MAVSRSSHLTLMTKKRVLALLVFLLLLYVIVPRFGSFSDSFAAMRAAKSGFVAVAIALLACTYLSAAMVYYSLMVKRANYWSTLLIQSASAFTNRLLPAGLGTLTLYVQYLRKAGHSLPQAVAVVGSNNILGMVAHIALLIVVLALTNEAYPARITLPDATIVWIILSLALTFVTTSFIIFKKLRRRAYRLVGEVLVHMGQYRKQPFKLVAALGFSLVTTVCYAAIFYCCALGVGIQLDVQHIFLVFTIGIIAGTATPTPGGLIGAEAGLTGGLIAYGVQPDTALAAALLYRFLTYWLPLVPGFLVFARIRRLYS